MSFVYIMYDEEIFVFGSKFINTESPSDIVSCLPLELSWFIFSYLDNTALRNASFAFKRWRRIILANRSLRSRLNHFELSMILGSERLARLHRRNTRLKRGRRKNYQPTGICTDPGMKTTVVRSKRGGDDIIVHTKRFKLF